MRCRPVVALVVSIAVAQGVAAPAAGQGGSEDPTFFTTYGLRQFEHTVATDGRTATVYRPEGALRDRVVLTLFADADGTPTSVGLEIDRVFFSDDGRAARRLVADYLVDAVPVDDRVEVAGLRAMILSDDATVRRGEAERGSGCCALPPIPGRDRAAVAVVDGLRDYSLVRLWESSVRFRSTEGLDGRPSLLVTVSGPEGPVQVVEAVFDAARFVDPSWLPDLCGAGVETDGDVEALCGLHGESERWPAFVEAFAGGEVTGPAQVSGDLARVPFRFGPDGTTVETMEVRNVAGRWVLVSF